LFTVLRKDRELRVFDNSLLRIFGTKKEAVMETWRIGIHLGYVCVDMGIILKGTLKKYMRMLTAFVEFKVVSCGKLLRIR
jgi:hypothetical protein